MAIQSYTSQLEEVQTAITKVLGGQSYSITSPDGTTITVGRADLKTLQDREAWLRQAVRSVLSQSDPDLEVVVVDDGSSEDVEGALTPLHPPLEAAKPAFRSPAA